MEVDIVTLITTVTTLVAGGGWFVNYRQKRDIEKAAAEKASVDVISDKADLTEKLLEKYQKTVLDSMGSHEARHNKLDESISEIHSDINAIMSYLNGGFVEFKKKRAK